MELKVGKIYKLQTKIGSGSFGEIYSAINIKTNEEVKFINVSMRLN